MVRVVQSFDPSTFKNIHINRNSVDEQIKTILEQNPVYSTQNLNAWLLKAITVIDLTTLSGDDTASNVTRLCVKAANPLPSKLINELGLKDDEKVRTAAVCVYPNRVPDAYSVLKRMDLTGEIQVASDPSTFKNIHINRNSVDEQIKTILEQNPVYSTQNLNAWLLKAITVIDLTTLSGDDTASNVTRICVKAANPLPSKLINELGLKDDEKVRTAAVCVYPNRVPDAYSVLKRMDLTGEIQVASVATGFPSGLYPLQPRLLEIRKAIDDGATEIDVVLDRSLVLTGKWDVLYDEVVQMRKECGTAHLKVILGVGELGTYENVYKASMVSMMAGADFIKTSTGKEAVNATLPVGLVMCRAIRRFYQMTGHRVGLKPAGGIKTGRDAVNWLVLVRTELGPEWLTPALFRIGASSVLDDIVNHLQNNAVEFKV